MRGVSNSILSKLLVVVPMVLVGCSDRDLRPLTPCTTSGASGNVPIQSLKNVDLIFLVDNSASMASEQAKLRAEFPYMIAALATGDLDGDDVPDGPAVESLRVAVITSDMGVLGVGTGGNGSAVQGCGVGFSSGALHNKANYGDDGVFRTQTRSVPLETDCDVDGTAGDDVIAVADLPTFLTFSTPEGQAPDPTALNEFNRRVSCLTNVGLNGCVYEQQLEAFLKAITPRDEMPEGGFFHVGSDADREAFRDRGHGDDPLTNDPGDGWFRDDSLLALVMVSDEEDCSARVPDIFNATSTVPPFDEDNAANNGGSAVFGRGQSRCSRFEEEGLWPVERYIKGFIARRSLSPGAFVFAAITGVPEDLTTGEVEGPGGTTIVRGTDNLQEILDDPRMAYSYVPFNGVPDATLAFACQHFDGESEVVVHADAASASTSLTNVIVQTSPTEPSRVGTSSFANGASTVMVVVAASERLPEPGQSVSGTNISPGTLVTSIDGSGPYSIGLSSPTTAMGTGVTLTFGATNGPMNEGFVFGTGIPAGVQVTAVSGTGPYTLTLSQPITVAAGDDIRLRFRDVEATPARRSVRVAAGLVAEPYFSNASVNSICVDTFRPAVERIINLIQQNLRGSCLPRSLIRNAQNQVNCDVFVTMPPNVACDDSSLNGAYAAESVRQVEAPANAGDTDGFLEVCRMAQVSVTAADIASNAPPTSGHGWFYDDYTDDADSCGVSEAYRVSFTKDGTTDDTPPQGARMSFSCAQPVQDGDLEIDINSACSGAGTACVFSTEAAGDEFALRYNLLNRDFSFATTADPTAESRFNCEFDSNTCQIACDSDAQCPGGYVCYDDPDDDDGNQAGLQTFCVNPICGTN